MDGKRTVKNVAVALIMVGATALSAAHGAAKVPPHLERIAYLEDHLGSGIYMKYAPDFEKVLFYADTQGGQGDQEHIDSTSRTVYVILDHVIQQRPLIYHLLSVRDTPLFGNDGDVDQVYLANVNGDSDRRCMLWGEDLPDDLHERLNRHYETSTEAAYLSLTEGKKSFNSSVGEAEFQELGKLCGW